MKKFLIATLIAILFLTACSVETENITYQPKDQPHLYYKDIDVEIISIDRAHWYASTHWYVVNLAVKSEEYGLTESFEIKGSGAFGCPSQWDYKEGQIVQAELYSWVMDSTGEVIRRQISQVY